MSTKWDYNFYFCTLSLGRRTWLNAPHNSNPLDFSFINVVLLRGSGVKREKESWRRVLFLQEHFVAVVIISFQSWMNEFEEKNLFLCIVTKAEVTWILLCWVMLEKFNIIKFIIMTMTYLSLQFILTSLRWHK